MSTRRTKKTLEYIIVFVVAWLIGFALYWIGMNIKFAMYQMSPFGKTMYTIGLYVSPTVLAAAMTLFWRDNV